MSKLNKDVLFLIFKGLRNDSKSLFSSLMVNRLWCETIIPILWKNPWCYDINYKNKNYLFIIITSYLYNDINELLTRKEIQLPLVSSQSLMFDYLSFCRSINIDTINTIISIGSSLDYVQFNLQQEFYSLFIKKCSDLKYFDIRSIKPQIFHFPEAKACLESLCELKCNTSIDSSYFFGLARYCQYIQRLIISNNANDYNGIIKLIEVQKNLKYFEWKDAHHIKYKVNVYREILFAVEKKADTINHIKLYFIHEDHTLQYVLPKLRKLKTLIVTKFGDFDENQLKTLNYHDLEVINTNYITLYDASIIIGNSGGHIKEILLKSYSKIHHMKDFDKESRIFIRKIYKKCPSIEYLSLIFSPSKKNFTEFKKLLKICQNLKSLLLVVFDPYKEETNEKMLENGKKILKVLIRSKPANLREIRFFDHFKFSLDAFEEFLGKWRGHTLSILTTDSIYERKYYKRLIDNYKNNGVIKAFKCESPMNVESMDFKI
jgi:hypothetical protein